MLWTCATNRFSVPITDKCSHHRSHQLFWETLTTNFTAIKCESYEEITKNRCTFDNVTAIMGGDNISNMTRPHGIFYLETTSDAPYVIPDYRSFDKIEIIYRHEFEASTESLNSTVWKINWEKNLKYTHKLCFFRSY